MSIDREESLFLTVSEDHSQRPIPEFVKTMGEPVRQLGGMAAAWSWAAQIKCSGWTS